MQKTPITWAKLGDIGEFIRGNGLQKRDFTESGCSVVHYGQIYTRYGFSASETISFTSEAVFAKLRKAREGDILMATTSENFEDLGKCVVWEGAHEVGVSGDMMIFRSQQNARFLAHWFSSYQFEQQKLLKISGTKVYRIHQDDMKNFQIPLPPLDVQRKIAEYLDLFEALISNIRTEKDLRSKQLRYYSELLLNPDNLGEFERHTLGDVLQYEQPTKYLVKSTNYDDKFATPVLTAGKTFILGYTDETEGIYPASPENPIVLFDDFTAASKWVDFPFKIKSSAAKIITAEQGRDVLRYCYFWLQVKNHQQREHQRCWISTVANFQIPIPPMQTVSKIAGFLDTIAALIANLERERELRSCQARYYKESLLNFAKEKK